ncbi:hypothetical protein AHiyo6_11610 [Arthrobacter sp. Hiyo6]|jgi:hypothetical protein|nr:hypothetical protein AHiyo6_11610 [Arthrobacter sp. Hiyo6]
MLEPAIDRLTGCITSAGLDEVRQHVRCSALEGASEGDQPGQRRGHDTYAPKCDEPDIVE